MFIPVDENGSVIWSVLFVAIPPIAICVIIVSVIALFGRETEVRDNWLADCQIKGRSLEYCAKAWDDSPSLRQIYRERRGTAV